MQRRGIVRFELLTISGSDDRSRRGRRRQCMQRGVERGDREKRRGWIEIGPAPSTFQLGSERKMANRTDVEVNQRGELVGWMDGVVPLPTYLPFLNLLPSHSSLHLPSSHPIPISAPTSHYVGVNPVLIDGSGP